ncbi:MAG: Cupin 2 conserved barrel domain protein [Parcubacteria group bacterium]|nr:Cupin 2 conserved barrel domain protein [Parcubacteria group bacterium]
MGFIGAKRGAQKLGSNITTLPAGKRAFPFHNHRENEELFFILEGEGELRMGTERTAVKKGDFIVCPPGGREVAHQIINTSDSPLQYLAISTKISPEIADYPDTGKFGILTNDFRYVGREDQSLDYWEGE